MPIGSLYFYCKAVKAVKV